MVAVILLAVALAMDAFAVAIGIGAKASARADLVKQALLAGVYFGLAQGVMPLIGYVLGAMLLGKIASVAPWIACVILVLLGVKMLHEALSADDTSESDNDISRDISKAMPKDIPKIDAESAKTLNTAVSVPAMMTHRVLFGLAIATSIDAMAAGFTLNLLPINAYVACLLIAMITAGFSMLGVYLGKHSGTWLGSRAEIFGGLVLIGIGIKMVL